MRIRGRGTWQTCLRGEYAEGDTPRGIIEKSFRLALSSEWPRIRVHRNVVRRHVALEIKPKGTSGVISDMLLDSSGIVLVRWPTLPRLMAVGGCLPRGEELGTLHGAERK